jgi:hypothetical protein
VGWVSCAVTGRAWRSPQNCVRATRPSPPLPPPPAAAGGAHPHAPAPLELGLARGQAALAAATAHAGQPRVPRLLRGRPHSAVGNWRFQGSAQWSKPVRSASSRRGGGGALSGEAGRRAPTVPAARVRRRAAGDGAARSAATASRQRGRGRRPTAPTAGPTAASAPRSGRRRRPTHRGGAAARQAGRGPHRRAEAGPRWGVAWRVAAAAAARRDGRRRRAASPPGLCLVSRPFPSWNRPILTEIYLCHACSCQEILRAETARQGRGLGAPSRCTRTTSPSTVWCQTAATDW